MKIVTGHALRPEETSAREPDAFTLAVVIPCYNESAAIERVVEDFRRACPEATIYVYDNASTDDTGERARAAGAIVRFEPNRGKGCVVRRMFADVSADVYVLVDGDGTYDPWVASALAGRLVAERLDFINIARAPVHAAAFRPGHRFGNRLLNGMVRWIFGRRFTDMLSGYKVLSRRFVKSFPILSKGFEIETELMVHALELGAPCVEVVASYGARAEGSESKLRTYHDGLKVAMLIARLVKDERPLAFFGFVGAALVALSFLLGLPIFETYFQTGLVPRLPTAVACVGLALAGLLSFVAGLILETVARGRLETKRLFYLGL